MAFIAITLIVSFLALLYALLKYRYSYWERRNVPHEKPLLFVGNAKGLGRTVHFRDINQRLYERFKGTAPFAGVYLFFARNALIIDLELIKRILIKDFSNFHDRGIFSNPKDDPLTGHLLTLEGEEWRSLRNKLSPTFTSGKLRFMLPTIVDVGRNLIDACAALAKQSPDGTVEVKELSARFTTDVIGTCAFGLECNSLQDPEAEFRTMGRSIFTKPRHSSLVQGFMISNPKLARRLRMKLIRDDLSEFFLSAVRRTVAYRLEHGIKRNDFMDCLIELKAKDEALAREGGGVDLSQGLTLEQMAAQAFVFFLAGFDTSSTTMSFCIYELALNSAIQERVRNEIEECLARHNGELTYECIKEMHYLDQVIAETLRKYPVLPNIIRKAIDNYPVPNSSYTIEAGTVVLIPVHAIHHDPELYPDPEKFDPERFTPQAIQERHPSSYLPFGDGPRNCIGMRFGKTQSKIGIITLLRAYRFSKSTKTEIPLKLTKANFLIETAHGISLKVDKI